MRDFSWKKGCLFNKPRDSPEVVLDVCATFPKSAAELVISMCAGEETFFKKKKKWTREKFGLIFFFKNTQQNGDIAVKETPPFLMFKLYENW